MAMTPQSPIESLHILLDDRIGERVAAELSPRIAREYDVVRCAAGIPTGMAWNSVCERISSEFIVVLVAGVSMVTERWCSALIGYAQYADNGVVAPALVLPDRSFHNAGIVLDARRATVRAHLGRRKDWGSLASRAMLAQNLTVPGGECMAFRRNVFTTVTGFDGRFADLDLLVADFCMRVRSSGRLNVWTPYVEGVWTGRRTSNWLRRDHAEIGEFLTRWSRWASHDPAYNANLSSGPRLFELAFPPRHSESVAEFAAATAPLAA
jgi:GT2 family glycosyltransferase